MLLQMLLALHLSGLVIMAGTTVVDYITYRTFWKSADRGDKNAAGLLPIMERYGGVVRTGAAVLVLTGIGMMILVKGVWGEQLWFRIKMGLVVILVLNGILAGNKQGGKLRQMIAAGSPDFLQQTAGIRARLNRFYLVQLAVFLLIIFISVLKFD
jgi:hypothetical protein